jgi:hypothetical protein
MHMYQEVQFFVLINTGGWKQTEFLSLKEKYMKDSLIHRDKWHGMHSMCL